MSGHQGISTGTPWDFDPAAVSDQALDTLRQVVLMLYIIYQAGNELRVVWRTARNAGVLDMQSCV